MLRRSHPLAQLCYFACVMAVAMCNMDVFFLLPSLLCAVLFLCMPGFGIGKKQWCFYILLFIIMSAVNPLLQHRGSTVLFFINDAPFTLQALRYGMTAALMILCVLCWCRAFSLIMTSDRILYLFGRLSPRFALLISAVLRYIPLYAQQVSRLQMTQRALGLYREGSIADGVRAKCMIFSQLVTWALENGIVTADSMAARGYGIGKRTHFHLFRFRRGDALLMLFSLLPAAVVFSARAAGRLGCTYYPVYTAPAPSVHALFAYLCGALLALIPFVLETGELLRWHYLRSKM